MTFEEYIQEYQHMSVEDFSKKCYDESCQTLKSNMLIKYIWDRMNDDEIKNAMELCGIECDSFDSMSNEDIHLIVMEYLFNLAVLQH